MKTAAYLRVFTAEQDEALQRQGITRFAEHTDLNVTDWYCDKGVSGRWTISWNGPSIAWWSGSSIALPEARPT